MTTRAKKAGPIRLKTLGDLYTIQGAADALEMTYWQVYRLVQAHRVPTYAVGKSLMVRLSDVQAARH